VRRGPCGRSYPLPRLHTFCSLFLISASVIVWLFPRPALGFTPHLALTLVRLDSVCYSFRLISPPIVCPISTIFLHAHPHPTSGLVRPLCWWLSRTPFCPHGPLLVISDPFPLFPSTQRLPTRVTLLLRLTHPSWLGPSLAQSYRACAVIPFHMRVAHVWVEHTRPPTPPRPQAHAFIQWCLTTTWDSVGSRTLPPCCCSRFPHCKFCIGSGVTWLERVPIFGPSWVHILPVPCPLHTT